MSSVVLMLGSEFIAFTKATRFLYKKESACSRFLLFKFSELFYVGGMVDESLQTKEKVFF